MANTSFFLFFFLNIILTSSVHFISRENIALCACVFLFDGSEKLLKFI